jgi:hypothetical protein
MKMRIYNETRETVIEMYIELRKPHGGGDELDHYVSNLNDIDILNVIEEDDGRFKDEVFIVKETEI